MKKIKFTVLLITVLMAMTMLFTACYETKPSTDNKGNPSTSTTQCDHNYTSKVTTEATCIQDGVNTFTCSVCNDSYTEAIAATGKHNYTSKVTTEATCIQDGVKTFACSVCNDSYTEAIAATGKHNYTSKVTTKATCTQDGVNTFTCSVCNDSYTEKINAAHNWIEATCTNAKHCANCSEVDGKALGHSVSGYACSRCNMGFGQVKGQVTWKYNNYVGTRGDDGAKVMLIPKNSNTKNYDNGSAAMFLPGTYDSGIIVTKCDGYGNYDFGDRIPEGEYICLIVSKNTTAAGRFNNEENWKSQITSTYGKYFSDEDLETLMLIMGYQSLASGTISVEKGRLCTVTKDFGYTYI